MAIIYANSMAARAGIVQVVDDNGNVLDQYQAIMPAFPKVTYPDNRDYIVMPGDTWHNISLKYLGTAELWWVIAEFNRVLDPFMELYPGKHITIPSLARARLVIANQGT